MCRVGDEHRLGGSATPGGNAHPAGLGGWEKSWVWGGPEAIQKAGKTPGGICDMWRVLQWTEDISGGDER